MSRFDLPATYHEHDGPTEHKHPQMGPGHYAGESGHFHLTEVYTADEVGAKLGLTCLCTLDEYMDGHRHHCPDHTPCADCEPDEGDLEMEEGDPE